MPTSGCTCITMREQMKFYRHLIVQYGFKIHVVVNFLPQFIFSFPLFLWMVISVKQRKLKIN